MKVNNEKSLRSFWPARHSTATGWRRPINNRVATTILFVFFIFLALFIVGCFDTYIFRVFSTPAQKKSEFPCTTGNQTQTCPEDYPSIHIPTNPSTVTCPSYFQWIHEDLRPWKETGITSDMIERARPKAHFRLVIVNGKAYVEKYTQSIQSRDMFTLWGILQLLRWYPGRLPDLELMFDCGDRPVVRSSDFQGPNASPPPLFRYCSDHQSLDIVFPDWSFWGW